MCFPETSPTIGLSADKAVTLAEPAPAPIFEFFATKAKEYDLNIILPMLELKDGNVCFVD